MTTDRSQSFRIAKDSFAELGVDVEKALEKLGRVSVSMQCWQGDDVIGFEAGAVLNGGGGIQATGNYPGRARNPDELRSDLAQALALIPGKHRLNLHASYAETGGKRVERDAIEPEHFQGWIDWCRDRRMGMDFNPTYFAHPKADSGFTLSHPNPEIRDFWIRHGQASRRISARIGRELKSPCVMNLWIPDGFKDQSVSRGEYRARLKESLDAVFSERFDTLHLKDCVEPKLFGIGSESCTIGSHEFYMGYAVANQILMCLDSGHFHPTEVVSDKISSALQFVPEVLLHVSRPVRWDSDHVVTLDDELRTLSAEIVRGGFVERVNIGMDFFDASINRVAAWVIGARNVMKAMAIAFLEPTETLKEWERKGDYTSRLMLLEELKTLPFQAVWDEFCERQNVPVGAKWFESVRSYEKNVLSERR